MNAPTPIAAESLRRLHPRSLTDRGRIQQLLQRVQRDEIVLSRATDRFSRREAARIVRLTEELLFLDTEHFEPRRGDQVFLNFELDGRPYFFSAPRRGQEASSSLQLEWPAVVYEAERRDRERRAVGVGSGTAARATLRLGGEEWQATIVDASPAGLGVQMLDRSVLQTGQRLEVQVEGAPSQLHGRVRSRRSGDGPAGWVRLGLELSEHPWPHEIPLERRKSILGDTPRSEPAPEGFEAPQASAQPLPRVVRYKNDAGEMLCGIVDVFGDAHRAPAVVIPSAWGRTKETLLPLALTIGATFRAAGQSVVVLRFDGIRRRGESHRDPESLTPGRENLRLTFSQGVRDVHATLDFLERSSEFQPRTSILVTFSVTSIEGRRALASDTEGRLGGWVSVVGSADAQSLTRAISGGVDFFGGTERGVRFGRQEIQGMLVDMDHAGQDALEERLAFLSDSRHDFAAIRAPITWLHGRHDAWMDLTRIRDALSFGESANRRLIEIPTGHQLRTSREALETFQLIACESVRMATGEEAVPALLDLALLESRRQNEMRRLEEVEEDLRGFWKDYVVGREGGVGMELVTHADPYERLMDLQIDALSLEAGDRVLDLGSGIGPFPIQLRERASLPEVWILEADFVYEALVRTRARLRSHEPSKLRVGFAQFDLDDIGGRQWIPIRDASVDAVLLSLVLNYVSEPSALLSEIHRLLGPGGRLVLSSLKRDADTSTICVDTLADLRGGRGRSALGADGERRMASSMQGFINDAARLLDFEERGRFQFWSAPELGEMLGEAGFRDVTIEPAFGDPPQAWVARAVRR